MNLQSIFKNADNIRSFSAGSIIFSEGDPRDVMYVILDGEVEVRIKDKQLEIIGPGSVFGEMALIDSKPRSATAKARSDCRLAPVDEKQFLFMVPETPFFALHIMRVLAERLRRASHPGGG